MKFLQLTIWVGNSRQNNVLAKNPGASFTKLTSVFTKNFDILYKIKKHFLVVVYFNQCCALQMLVEIRFFNVLNTNR